MLHIKKERNLELILYPKNKFKKVKKSWKIGDLWKTLHIVKKGKMRNNYNSSENERNLSFFYKTKL